MMVVQDRANLDDRQQQLYDALDERSPALAGTYRAAIRMLGTPAVAGEERARVSLIGNAMREVMNALPSVIGETTGRLKGRSASALARELSDALALSSDLDLRQDLDYIPVPRAVAIAIDQVVQTVVLETKQVRDDAAALLAEGSSSDHPAVGQWIEAREFFVRWTHLERPPRDNGHVPTDVEILRNIRVVEDLVAVRTAGFFDTRRLLDELLAEINRADKPPTSEQVQYALRQIPTLQLRRVFFEGNNSPLWLQPLAAAGVFSTPPEPTPGDDGYTREPYWPEIEFLTRMAGLVPDQVVGVFLALRSTSNSWVRRAVFDIGARIPAEHAARLVPMILEWGVDGLGWRTDPRSQGALTKNLLDNGETKAGLKLANLLFRPRAEGQQGKVEVAFEDYWYAEELPKVAQSLGEIGLRTITPWLEDCLRLNESVTEDFDVSYLRRAVIGRKDHSLPSVEHALIDTVRDLATASIRRAPDRTISMLSRTPILLLRRIVLFATAEALLLLHAERGDTVAIISAGKDLISDPLSSQETCWLELAHLIKAVADIAPDELAELALLIGAVPRVSTTAVGRYPRREDDVQTSPDERSSEPRERWQHRLLAAIGVPSLPPELQQRLSELDAEHGVIESPLAPDLSSGSWRGPTSPSSQTELSAMDPRELVAHLESWRIGDDWRGPTHEGQGRELTTLVSTNPFALAGMSDLVERLRPTYLRAVLTGWEAAIKAGFHPEWSQLLDVTHAVLDRAKPSVFAPEGHDFEDDRDYGHAKHAAIGLLEEVTKKRSNLSVPNLVLEQVGAVLIAAAEDDGAWSEYASRLPSNPADPFAISLTSRWPVSVRGLVNLLSHGPDSSWFHGALVALERELGRPDRHGAIHAVVGESLVKLHSHAPDWLTANLARLFGGDEGISTCQQVALTTALAAHHSHKATFELLREPLSAALRLEEPIAVGWKGRSEPLELIGQWIVESFVWGDIDINDTLLRDFFELVPPATRGAAVANIAWQFVAMKSVDVRNAQRLGELWDERVANVRANPEERAELGDFYWFVKCREYPVEWWLPRLVEAAELHGRLNSHGMIGEVLAQAAPVNPRTSLDALRLLLPEGVDAEARSYDLTEYAAPAVIAAGFASDDEQLRTDSRQLMHALGARGYLDLEQRVLEIVETPGKPQEK
ncbi:hypothetical protein [Arthrobacter sp. YN]|uniref:hypothetical protein n=1 Tax=Arthrobacter sp. YN TaxID=2020486 RepID=UPI000B5FE140|nr:hypothetical protein [Arthrobacter sp. YN]ASN19929.1 hypothetical protein CGK93_09765 [Arthrobacter sp. YN]